MFVGRPGRAEAEQKESAGDAGAGPALASVPVPEPVRRALAGRGQVQAYEKHWQQQQCAQSSKAPLGSAMVVVVVVVVRGIEMWDGIHLVGRRSFQGLFRSFGCL